MAVKGLKNLKVKENDCVVEDKGDFVSITFDNPIDVDGKEVKEFKLNKPTLEDIEIATDGVTNQGYAMLNAMLSTFLEPKIAPNEFKTTFTIKEHSALVEVINVFL